MNCSLYFAVYFLALFIGYSESAATFRFANIYGHHMVLQQAPRCAVIWGFGEVGRYVWLTVDRRVYSSKIKPGRANSSSFMNLSSQLLESRVPAKAVKKCYLLNLFPLVSISNSISFFS